MEVLMRYLSPSEMLSSHVVPMTRKQAAKCGAPALDVRNTSEREQVRMAGNAMSVPCVGAFLLCAIMMVEPVK